MRPSTPLEFPGSRYVAGWWKQLAPLRPRALWVAHLLFHHVEALVQTNHVAEPDALTILLLQALRSGDTVIGLAARLCVAPALAARLLHQLRQDGLARHDHASRWGLTQAGQHALDQGRYVRPSYERRLFHFITNDAGQPPHYLAAPELHTRPWQPEAEWTFDVGWLERCTVQTAEWKHRHGFPREIEAIVTDANVPADEPSWLRVMIDQPGYLPAALVRASAEHGERLLGFPVDPEGWTLNAREAALIVHADWQQVLPDFAVEPSTDAWREAWLGWCQRRGLPTVEAEECVLEWRDAHLRVRAPARLLDRLRAGRSEALKGEAWLLAGAGRVRMASQIEMVAG